MVSEPTTQFGGYTSGYSNLQIDKDGELTDYSDLIVIR